MITSPEAFADVFLDRVRLLGVVFFRAEVATDVDERRAGLSECLSRVSDRFHAVLEEAATVGWDPASLPTLETLLAASSHRCTSEWSSLYPALTRPTPAPWRKSS